MAQAIKDYFEGDMDLFHAYRTACLAQFPNDVRDGDAASASTDLQALRRVAHSLKSVMLTLGFPYWSTQARELEDNSHAGRAGPALQQWASLRAHLLQLLQSA